MRSPHRRLSPSRLKRNCSAGRQDRGSGCKSSRFPRSTTHNFDFTVPLSSLEILYQQSPTLSNIVAILPSTNRVFDLTIRAGQLVLNEGTLLVSLPVTGKCLGILRPLTWPKRHIYGADSSYLHADAMADHSNSTEDRYLAFQRLTNIKMEPSYKIDEGYSEGTRSQEGLDSPMRMDTEEEQISSLLSPTISLQAAALALSENDRKGMRLPQEFQIWILTV